MSDQNSSGCQCRDHERATFDRPTLFLPLILVMLASFGGLVVLAMAHVPYGVQIGSVLPYTCLIVLVTFSAQRGQQPYFFECYIVRSTMQRLVRRHIGFIVAIILVETIAIYISPFMPPSWLVSTGRNNSPFAISLCIICLCFGFVQAFSNRSLIERAHRESGVLLD